MSSRITSTLDESQGEVPNGRTQNADKRYKLVEFLKDASTCCVPECWVEIINGKVIVYWPRKYKRAEFRHALLEGEEPNKRTWDSYEGKIHYTGSYKKCMKKEKTLLEAGSNLSAVEEEMPGIGGTKQTTPSRPFAHMEKTKSVDRQDPGNLPGIHVSPGPSTQGQTPTTPRRRKNQKSVEDDIIDTEEIPRKRKCRTCSNACEDCQAKAHANEKFQRKILRLLYKILSQLDVATDGRPVIKEALKVGEITLAVKSVTALTNVENTLTPDIIPGLKASLRPYVGKTAWLTAVKMMQSIMTVSVMKQLNWEERNKNKVGFTKIASKLANAIEEGAKEATVEEFKPCLMRDKLMKVLVKAKSLEENPGVIIVQEQGEQILPRTRRSVTPEEPNDVNDNGETSGGDDEQTAKE